MYIPLKVEGNKGAHGIGRQREFAFIRFKDREAAHDAIFRMNGADFHGRTLKVEDSTQVCTVPCCITLFHFNSCSAYLFVRECILVRIQGI